MDMQKYYQFCRYCGHWLCTLNRPCNFGDGFEPSITSERFSETTMATAKKCDVCGRLYEIYNDKNDKKKVNGLMFLNVDARRQYFSHEVVDCCPQCMFSIKNHIELLSIKTTKQDGDTLETED